MQKKKKVIIGFFKKKQKNGKAFYFLSIEVKGKSEDANDCHWIITEIGENPRYLATFWVS